MSQFVKLRADRRTLLRYCSGIVVFLGFLLLLAFKERMALHLAALPNDTGHFTRVATIASLLIVVTWILLLPAGRWRIAGAFCLDFLITGLLYSDVLYSRQFGDLTSAFSLKYAGQVVAVRTAVESLVRPGDWRLWADLPVILLLFFTYGRVAGWLGKSTDVHSRFGTRLRVVFVIVLVAVGVDALCISRVGISAWNQGGGRIRYWVGVRGQAFFEPRWSGNETPEEAGQLGFLNYHAFDLYRYAVRTIRLRPKPTRAGLLQVRQWFDAHHRAIETAPTQNVDGHEDNLIVLQVESLQEFVIGLRIGGQEVTPNLNRLASESLRFTHFYTQVSVGMTADADLLANCSLYPLPNQVVYYDYDDDDFRCMPALARSRGYSAVAMQGINPTFWNLQKVYPRVGFEDFYNLENGFVLNETIGMGLSDKSFFRQAVKLFRKVPQPFYAFLVTLSSHSPFNETGIPRTLRLGRLEGTEAGNYLNAVHYTDAAIGSFIESLDKAGLLDRSIIAVYGDHYGITPNTPGYSSLLELLSVNPTKELATTNFQYRIPFIVKVPGISGRKEPQLGGEVDIAPTLAGILGFPTQQFFFMGRNLLTKPDGTVSLSHGTVFGHDFYWLQNEQSAQGKCYKQGTGTIVPDVRCSRILSGADSARRISRFMVEENLITRIATPASRVPQKIAKRQK